MTLPADKTHSVLSVPAAHEGLDVNPCPMASVGAGSFIRVRVRMRVCSTRVYASLHGGKSRGEGLLEKICRRKRK